MPTAISRVEIIGAGSSVDANYEDLISFIYDEKLEGSAKFLIHVRTKDHDAWEDVLTDPEAEVKIRWVYDGDERIESPLKTVNVTFSRITYGTEAADIYVEGMCKGWQLHSYWKDSVVFKDKRISEIVEALASAAGLDSQTKQTDGKYTLYLCSDPAGYFIKHKLLPRAVAGGRSDFLFWIKDGNTVVFEPPELSGGGRTYKVISPDVGPEHVDFHQIDNQPGLMSPFRSLKTRVKGFDRVNKRYIEFDADDNSVQYPKLASRAPEVPEEPTRTIMTTAPWGPKYEEKDVERVARAVWSEYLRVPYQVLVEPSHDFDVKVGEVANFEGGTSEKKNSFASGRYLVWGVRHWNLDGDGRVLVTLVRRTSQ